MEDPNDPAPPGVLSVLEALRKASHDLHFDPKSAAAPAGSPDSASPAAAVKALLELETESDSLLSRDPNLSALSRHLSALRSLVSTLQECRGRYGLGSFLARRVSAHSISRVAESIESEIQAWIDRETVEKLVAGLREKGCGDEEELVKLLSQLEARVLRGFERDLQDLLLKSKLFGSLETTLCNQNCSKRVREHVGFTIAALIRFNKDVFVGQVLMGATIRALITMASAHSLKVLCSLIRSIKSPLVDEIQSNGQIPKIINFLNHEDLQVKVVAMDCILEIGYFGRKEAIEAMIEEGIVKKLVELQRLELGGDLIDLGRFEQSEVETDSMTNAGKSKSKSRRFLESHPFASCVARFAIQLEVGEGLRQREKREFKQEILVRVREVSANDAEAATIVAEVLWGSSP
ncbi:uncharacterized protein LOC115694415 [Syzygium oleosum]|uniref:uncharacterized protein LOC115694415 n=1 Tax=Syzygium oleosum TaxID=219896 RepID=UPI0011D18D78|nr:uncharacterized protein LOC115694415 [Syzygium oleosum]